MKAITCYPHFKGYAIDTDGAVYSHKSSRYLTQHKHNHGYRVVSLSEDGCTIQMLTHRLVAMTYIPNPDNLPTVNHIDGDKTNNSVSNLEWMSYKDNNQHAIDTGLTTKQSNKHDDTLAHRVCQLLMDGWKQVDVTRSLGLDKSDVKQIRYSGFYSHVTCEYDWSKCPTRATKVSVGSAHVICDMLSSGESYQKISIATGVTVRNIKNIKWGVTFKSIAAGYSFLK